MKELHYSLALVQTQIVEKNNGKTALMIAIEAENAKAVTILSELSDCTIQDNQGRTALIVAEQVKQKKCKHSYPCEHVTIYNSIASNKNGTNVNTPDSNGNTPLMNACRTGSEEVVKLLLAHNADYKITRNGKRVLHMAQSPAIIQLLQEAGAEKYEQELKLSFERQEETKKLEEKNITKKN